MPDRPPPSEEVSAAVATEGRGDTPEPEPAEDLEPMRGVEVADLRNRDWVCTRCAGAQAVCICASLWCAHSVCEDCRLKCDECLKWFCGECSSEESHRCAGEGTGSQSFTSGIQEGSMGKTPSGFLALPDTGAVNASMGYDTLVEYDREVLKPRGLGVVAHEAPKSCGGIGGEAQIVGAVLVPLAMGSAPGVAAVVVILGGTPFLIPVGLLKALGGNIDLVKNVIRFLSCDGEAPIEFTESGHPSIDVTDGLEYFEDQIPDSERFKRGPEHARVMRALAQSAEKLRAADTRAPPKACGAYQEKTPDQTIKTRKSSQTKTVNFKLYDGDSDVETEDHGADVWLYDDGPEGASAEMQARSTGSVTPRREQRSSNV